MREIKFRFYCEDSDTLSKAFTVEELANGTYDWHGDIHKIVKNQYTGLKDKNKEEIYEGDILSHHLQGNRFVEYGSPFKNYGGYMLVSKNGMRGTLNDSDKLYEVIGNIYENPELLNK